jgi:hypothetical protein
MCSNTFERNVFLVALRSNILHGIAGTLLQSRRFRKPLFFGRMPESAGEVYNSVVFFKSHLCNLDKPVVTDFVIGCGVE